MYTPSLSLFPSFAPSLLIFSSPLTVFLYFFMYISRFSKMKKRG